MKFFYIYFFEVLISVPTVRKNKKLFELTINNFPGLEKYEEINKMEQGCPILVFES